jgi:hypothetical protein
MPTTIEQKNRSGLKQGPQDDAGLNQGLDLIEKKAKAQNSLDSLYQNILEKNLHEIKEEESEKKAAKTQGGLKDKLNQYSKVVFSRESTYRGIIDILAEELPSLVVESFRGLDSMLEHLFKYVAMTSVIMGVPIFTKFFAKNSASKILKEIDPKKYGLALLFNREDLENAENFEKAKERIVKEETIDKMNFVRLKGLDSPKAQKHIDKAQEIKDFVRDIENSETIRKEALELKNTVIKKQTLLMSVMSGAVPYIVRLFRKYALGVDRFVGSEKYLDDKDAKKLGSKGFTLRQALGTLACMITSPIAANHLVKQFNTKKVEERNGFEKMMGRQLDTRHSFFPKIGTYIMSTSVPYFISKIFNAQDKYEFLETLIKSSFGGGSLFLGDRVTNGRFAKAADKELSEKYGSEPGILHHPQDPKNGFWSWLGNIFPDARKFPEIIEKTQHNKELQKDATEKYQNSFLKGFSLHTIGIVVLKYAVNALTKHRVTSDLKKIKAG